MRHLVFLILLAAPGLAVQTPTLPETAAGRAFTAWLAAFNSGEPERVRAFETTWRERPAPVERTLGLREQTGGFTLVRIERSEPTMIVALATEADADSLTRIEFTLNGDPAPKVTRISLAPTPRPADLAIPRLTESAALAALTERMDALAAQDRFAGIVLVARDGKVLLQKTAGLADRATRTAVTPDTKFRIGSMNKMFTAIATLQLVEAKQLALDDPIGKHLPDYPNREIADKVLVRHLLAHRGGTGDIFGPDFDQQRLTLREHADYLALYGARAPLHAPDAEFRYSNYGFVLLGAVLERVSGGSYYDFVRVHVFKPAGMTATDSLPETESVPGRSTGYMQVAGAWSPNTDTLPWRGTAAVSEGFGLPGGYTTAGDLLRFAQALQAGTLVSKATLALATSARSKMGSRDYGYGFQVGGAGPLWSYGHGGGAPGMNGELRIYPQPGYVVVALSNLDPPVAQRLVEFFENRMPVVAPTTRPR